MGNYQSIGKYKIKDTSEDGDGLNNDSKSKSNSKKDYQIIEAYNGIEKGFLLLIPTKKNLYDSNLNLMNEVFEIITSKQKENKLLIKVKEFEYDNLNERVVVYFSFPERSKFISIKDYIDGIDLYYLNCSHIRSIAIKLNEIIKFLKKNNLPIPFLSPDDFFFDKKTLSDLKYIYIYPYFQYFIPNGYDFYSKISFVIPKKVKYYFPKSKYLNWNIGLFLYRILFRETPNYHLKTKDGINYYSIDIKDYRISDYDESLFDLLHYLLDIEIHSNEKVSNFNLIEKEDENFNIYLTHPFFENKAKNEFEIINSIPTKKYTLNKIKKKIISSIIHQVDKFKRLTMHDISKKLVDKKTAQFLFNNSELFMIYCDQNIEVYDMDYKLLYKQNEDNIEIIHSFNKGFLFKTYKNDKYIYGSFIVNKKNCIKSTIIFPSYCKGKYQDYFITYHNKLLIHNTYDKKDNMTLVYDFNGLIIGKSQKSQKIQLQTIIHSQLFEKKDMIVENVKSNELISLIDQYIYFYENEIYTLKFKLYNGNSNGIIKKIDDEIFLIGNKNYFYLLKNHKFLFTFYTKKGFWKLKDGILLNKNLLLCLIHQEFHYSYSDDDEYPKYGEAIIDEPDKKYPSSYDNQYDRLILYQIDDNCAIKQKINTKNVELNTLYYLKDNIIRDINKKGKYKYYKLEEEQK